MRKWFADGKGRLRAGWRILVQLVGFLFLLATVQSLQDAARAQRSALVFVAGSLLYLLGGLGLVWLAGRWLDRRRFTDFGFHLDREWWLDLGVGFSLGALTLTIVFLVERAAGWLEIESIAQSRLDGGFPLVGAAILLNLAAVGVMEELTFRGYQLRNLAEGLPARGGHRSRVASAWLATSLLFGLAHVLGPNASAMGGLNVALAGLLLGWGYVVTGELALPIGLHVGWGLFEEFVYGLPNSGQAPVGWLIGSRVEGPELWTGGAFGPEAGVLVTLMIALDALCITAWVKHRGRWRGIREEISEGSKVGSGPVGPVPAAW